MRVEQLSPFPFHAVAAEAKKYQKADLLWCQEEPMNMGAWSFVNPRFETALKGNHPVTRLVMILLRSFQSNPLRPSHVEPVLALCSATSVAPRVPRLLRVALRCTSASWRRSWRRRSSSNSCLALLVVL